MKYAWKTRLYRIWSSMKGRCNNPNNRDYKLYGGRGITYDPKWETFEGFYEDMHETYKEGLTLNRIDNNGNYTKDNCNWITNAEQQLNKRTNHMITINGITKPMAQWAREFNISIKTIESRIRRGWSDDELFKPVKTAHATKRKR